VLDEALQFANFKCPCLGLGKVSWFWCYFFNDLPTAIIPNGLKLTYAPSSAPGGLQEP